MRKPRVQPSTYTYVFQEFEVVHMLEQSLRKSTQVIPPGKCKLHWDPSGELHLILTEELKEGAENGGRT